jgi:ABC-type transport system involved in multi-copper enzyme maturation permease subunit
MLIKSELYKLQKSKGFKIQLIFMLLASITLYLYISFCRDMKPEEHFDFSGIAILFQLLSSIVYINFISSVFAITFVIKDFEKQTINRTYTYGYTRFQILIAKLISYLIGVLILEGFFIMMLTLLSTIFNGFGEELTFIGIIYLLKLILINIICCISLACITFLIAIITQSIIATIFSPIFVLIIYIISINIPILSNILPVNLLKKIYEGTTSISMICLYLFSCIFLMLISIGLSNIFLNKKELK